MGGCASKPKETDGTVPVEAPATDTVPQETGNGVETEKEAPLVDLSEPKPQGGDETIEAAKPETATGELDASTETKVKAEEVKAEEVKPEAATTEVVKETAEVKSS